MLQKFNLKAEGGNIKCEQMDRQEGGRGLNNIVASFQRGGIINKMQIVLFLLELLLQ